MISTLSQVSVLPALLRHPGGSRQAILRFQNRQLRRVISHAYAQVPYYRRLFDAAAVKPEDIRSAADLIHIPITTKADLRSQAPEDLVSRGVDFGKLIAHTTGGSSGEPFVIRRTWLEERILGVLRLRALRYYGLRRKDKLALLLFNHEPNPGDYQLPQRIMRAVHRVTVLPLHCLIPAEAMLERLTRFQPDVVGGYAGVLTRVAQTVAAAGVRSIRPRLVLSGGEVLTPLMAHQISEAFSAPVYDTYGSHEFSRTAWQCTVTGEYHVCDDGVALEVIADGRPVEVGQHGEVVATALHSFAMPFIRYRLGDIVTRGGETCGCGEPFSTLRKIRGRMVDYFPLPDGRLLHPYELAAALRDNAMRWIGQYRLVQEERDRIVLLAVPAVSPTPEQLSELVKRAASVLGVSARFEVRLVNELALEKRGKFRVYQSMVRSEYDSQTDTPYDTPGISVEDAEVCR